MADRPEPNFLERGAWLPALLFGIVLLTFLPCLRNGFVNFDDPFYAAHNPHVQAGLTRGGLEWAQTGCLCLSGAV